MTTPSVHSVGPYPFSPEKPVSAEGDGRKHLWGSVVGVGETVGDIVRVKKVSIYGSTLI